MKNIVEKLNLVREKIDTIDNKILDLIEARSILAQEVIKAKNNKNIFNPIREEKLIKNLVLKTKALKPDYIEDIWRIFIIENLYLQGGLQVFLGPEKEVKTTAKWYFGKSASINICESNIDAISKLLVNKYSAVILKHSKDLSLTFEIDGIKIKKIVETPIFKMKNLSKIAIYKRIDEI